VSNASNDFVDPVAEIDSGHVFNWSDADSWIAIFAVPREPYYLVIPIIKWVLVKRDGREHRDALIPVFGNPEPQLLSVIAPTLGLGMFVGHANVPLQSHSELTSPDGRTPYRSLVDLALQRGMEWAQLLQQQQATSSSS